MERILVQRMNQLKPQHNSGLSSQLSNKLNSHISPWLAKVLYPIGCYLVIPFFFGKIKINGRENIPREEPVIVAPTHRSRWDAVVVPYAVGRLASGRDLRFMVSANEVKGIQGWVIRRMGGFPVDTDRPRLDSVRHSIEVLKQDREMLVIFPEGGIFNDRKIHPLKRGVALIALEAQTNKSERRVKILPIGIRYSDPVPKWGTEVTVDIGPPLTVADYLSSSLRQSSQKLTLALEENLKEIYEV